MTGNKFYELSGFLSGAAEVSQLFRYVSTLDDETTKLSRSVEHKSPNDAAPHPRTTDSSSLSTHGCTYIERNRGHCNPV
jgi:hypothetical protein